MEDHKKLFDSALQSKERVVFVLTTGKTVKSTLFRPICVNGVLSAHETVLTTRNTGSTEMERPILLRIRKTKPPRTASVKRERHHRTDDQYEDHLPKRKIKKEGVSRSMRHPRMDDLYDDQYDDQYEDQYEDHLPERKIKKGASRYNGFA